MEGKKVPGKGGEISKVIFNLMLSQKNQITVLKNFSVIPRLNWRGRSLVQFSRLNKNRNNF